MNIRAAVDLHLLGLAAVHDEGLEGLMTLLKHLGNLLGAERMAFISGDDEASSGPTRLVDLGGPTRVSPVPEGVLDQLNLTAEVVRLDRAQDGYDLLIPIRTAPSVRPMAHLLVRVSAAGKHGRRPTTASLRAVSQLLANILIHRGRHQQLHEAATRDGLTGLFSRARLNELAVRIKGSCCVLMIDVDHFKRVNDTHGHQAGDQVLIGVARVLERCLRASDLIGRYGGEEFVCVLEGDEFVGELLAERIRVELEKTPMRIGRERIRITASIGFAEYDPDGQLETLTAAIALADRAMYLSKENGRNRVTNGRH